MLDFILNNILLPLSIMSVLFYPLQYWLPGSKQPFIRRDTKLDVMFYLMLSIFTHALSIVIVFVTVKVLFVFFHEYTMHELVTGFGYFAKQPVALQFIFIAIIHDFISYWVHRLFHHPWLWRWHAIHHGSCEVDWLSGFRIHPLETFIMYPARRLSLLFLGFPLPLILAYDAAFAIFGGLVHCNVKFSWGLLRYIFVSPLFHHWHHTREKEGENKNFALLFSFWDLLFQTWYLPKRFPYQYGISEKLPNQFISLLVYPFRREISGNEGRE